MSHFLLSEEVKLLQNLKMKMEAENVGEDTERLEEWKNITERMGYLCDMINCAESHAQLTAAIKVIEEIRARVKKMKIVPHLWWKVDSTLDQSVEYCVHWGGKDLNLKKQ